MVAEGGWGWWRWRWGRWRSDYVDYEGGGATELDSGTNRTDFGPSNSRELLVCSTRLSVGLPKFQSNRWNPLSGSNCIERRHPTCPVSLECRWLFLPMHYC